MTVWRLVEQSIWTIEVCDAVQDIRNDLYETMKECREVTEKYRTGRSAYLRLGQLFMRLFAGLL